MAASRHLWVGGLPEEMSEDDIRDYFTRFGKVETVKLLPQKYANMGLAAFVDFYDIEAAKDARNAEIKIKGNEVRTNYKSVRPETKEGREHSRRYYNSPHTKDDSSSSSSEGSSSNSDSSSSSSDSDSDDKGQDLVMLKVTNLPHRSDNEVLTALYTEFSHYSSKVVVKLLGDGDNKYCIMKFRSTSECKKALKDSQGFSIFGSKIKLTTYKRDFPIGGKEYTKSSHSEDVDPNATRSLFVGNIPKNISIYELRDVFQRFGTVLDVEIKKMGGNATYGFILYYDLHSAVSAKKYMDGTVIGGNNIRVGFGKGTPSKVLWVDCIESSVSEQQLDKQFSKYGRVVRMGYDHYMGTAMVQYETVEEAGDALNNIKGSTIGSGRKKIMADYANKDAKAAFFARLERISVSNGPRPFHPSGPLYPIDGMPPVMMGGPMPMLPHHVDYYRPYSYMDDYYGYPQPPPTHMRHPYEPRGYGDYEDELRAFSRKRERERRMEREEEERRRRRRGYSSDGSSDSDRDRRRKGKRRKWSSSSDEYRRERKGHSSDDSLSRRDARKRSRRTSRNRQEKRSKRDEEEKPLKESPKEHSKNKASSRESSVEDGKKKIEADECGSKKVDEATKESPSPVQESGLKDRELEKRDSNKPMVVIDYQLQEEEEEQHEKRKKIDETRVIAAEEKELPTKETKAKSSVESVVEHPQEKKEKDIPKLPEKEEELPRPPSPPPEEALLPVSVRPKISIAWKERDKPLQQQQQQQQQESNTRIESDFSSGDEFENMEEDEVIVDTEESVGMGGKTMRDDELERRTSVSREEHRGVILSHSSETSSEGSEKKGSCDQGRAIVQESRHRDEEVSRKFDDRQRYRHEDDRGKSRNRNYESRESRHYSRYHQDQRKRGGSPPSVRPRSPPVSPARSRPRTPIQRPPKMSRHRPPGSPQRDNLFRGRHTLSPSHPRHKESSSRGDFRDKRDARDRSPRGIPRGSDRSRLDSPPRRDSPSRHYSRHHRNSRSPSPRRHLRTRDSSAAKSRRDGTGVEKLPSRPRTPSGSPPLPPSPPEAPVEVSERVKVKAQVQLQQQVKPKEPSPQADVHDLLRRYPVMWQGHFSLKNELAAVQLHLLSGNSNLVGLSLPQLADGKPPNIRITQRMKLEQSQLDGVESRMKNVTEHCLLLAFPTGRDASDVQAQTSILKNSLINYLLQKQAAGIVNIQKGEGNFVLHIFPPCPFSQSHLSTSAPDLVNSSSDNCHLMIVIATSN